MTAATDRTLLSRVVLFAVLAVALVGCRLDVVAEIVVDPDGTGTITVIAEADAELVDRVPTIADDLVLDDVAAAGWVIDGPNPTTDGGLAITLTHDFDSKDQATNLLRSLGPPFNQPVIGRGQNGDSATNTASFNLGLTDGFAAFADTDLVNIVGGVPFAEQFESADVTPENSFGAVLRLTLPGDLVETETNATMLPDGRLEWVVPMDGSILEATARSEQAPSAGGVWARPVATVALIALIAWVIFMTIFIGYVAVARARRARRYRQRLLP